MVQLASEAVTPTRSGRLIILDRDGVINHDSDQFIKSPEEWRPIPGSLEAIARLNHAGYRVVVYDRPSLDEVVATMAEHKYGSAIVVQNQHVVGVFTTVDACRALSELYVIEGLR